MTITMAFTITTHTSSFVYSSSFSSSSSSPTVGKTSCLCSFSNPAISIPNNAIFQQVKCIPQLGFTPFPLWNGFKQTGFSILPSSLKTGKKGKGKGKGVYASLFGVGAPEVLVIGVVALLVFGPKGLAEVARNLGKTLREFQPTIKELQEVSREFKSTLEREIGLDDPTPKSSTSDTTKPKSEDAPTDSETKIEPNGSSGNEEDSSNDRLKVRADSFLGALAQIQKEQEEEEERKRIEREKEEAEKQERETSQDQTESQTPSQDTAQALDDSQEASSSVDNPDNNALEEAASVTTASDNPENNASAITATDNPENNVLQEAASMVPSGAATKTESES